MSGTVTERATTTHLLGRTGSRHRVTVDVTLRRLEPTAGQVDTHHMPVVRPYWELSIMGQIGSGRTFIAAGQCREAPLLVEHPGHGWTRADLTSLARIWERWHLNAMRAGCVHMVNEDLIREPDGYGGTRIATRANRCIDGADYFYGQSWLVEQLPESIIDEVRRLQALPTHEGI